MIELVGFDLDGTLADTLPISVDIMKKTASKFSDREITDEDVCKTFGMDEAGMLQALIGEYWKEALTVFYQNYLEAMKNKSYLFDGVLELLSTLKAKNVPLVLITGRGKKSCMMTLEALGLCNFFENIYTGSPDSNIKSKHLHDILLKYQLSPSEMCYVGDSLFDVTSCNDVGITCLSVIFSKGYESDNLIKSVKNDCFYTVAELQVKLLKMLALVRP